MSKHLPALKDQDKRVAEALRLHEIVMTSAAQMAVAAAKAGLELKAMKKEAGHGAWEEFFEANFAAHGITLRTAQRYMSLADGLKGKALKNDTGMSFLKLLDSAPSALSKADQEKLTKVVAKAADGATLTELYADFGIAKKAQGSSAKGGRVASKVPDANAKGGAEAEAELARKQTEYLTNLLDEALRDRPFNAAPEAARKKLHGLLVDLAAAVKGTL